MKNLFKMMLMFFCVMLIGTFAYSQEEEVPADFTSKIFTPTEMNDKWTNFSKDKGWQALTKSVEEKGYKKAAGEKGQWGFEASYTENGQKVATFVCMFAYVNSKGDTCTAMWAKKGTEAYKAYITFPPGAKDITKAKGTEMYVDANNKIQKANSWYTCWSGRIIRCRTNSVCAATVISSCLTRTLFNWFPCVFLSPLVCVNCIQYYATYCIGH